MNHAETLEFMLDLDPMKPRFLRGPAGIGKDALVHEVGTALKLEVLELPLHELEPPDVVGLPYVEAQYDGSPGHKVEVKSTAYARPHWWPTKPLILFLNEIDLASEMMFPSAMRLADRRMAGQLKLPDGVIIMAAGNGAQYSRHPMDQALLRRFAVIDYAPTVDEWLAWAREENLHASVLDYIEKNQAALDTPESLIGKRNLVVPTRASWTDFARHLNRIAANGKSLIKTNAAILAAPFVGRQAARQFQSWLESPGPQLKLDDIYAGKVDPKKTSLVQASSIIGVAAAGFAVADVANQRALMDFFMGVGDEAFAGFFAELPKTAAPIIRGYKPANDLALKISESL